MKIGLDAKWFFDGPPSGKIVVQNIVKQIIQYNTNDDIYVILDKKDKNKTFPYEGKNIHLVYVWAKNNLLSNVFIIPFITYSIKLDIIIFQNFSPILSNFKRYAFVHDVIFKSHPEYYTLIERIYFLPLRLLTRYSHGVCTVSEAEKLRMAKYGYSSKRETDVVYHGVDENFQPFENQNHEYLKEVRKKYSLPEKFLLYVGRLNVRKNVFNLLRSISLLQTDMPLVLVGSYDWKMTSVDDVIKQEGIEDRIIFTGPVFGKELTAIYSLANIFCFPSYEESFGLPALEGMASGVPVVVSNRSSLPEICGDAGNYADPDDPQSIATAINELISDNDLYKKKRELGLERAQRFKWEISAKGLMANAHRVCQKGKA